jgi:hypothetical protein
MPTVATKCPTKNNPEYVALAKCYVLGEKLMDNGFKNAVVDALFDAMSNQPFYPHHYPGQRPIKIIHDGTLEGPPARRLLVDIWTTEAEEHGAQYINNGMPADFTCDLAKALLGGKATATESPERSWEGRAKDYYET